MARSRIVVDLATGEQSVVPYTPEEEAEADAAYEAEQNKPPPPITPAIYAVAQLTITAGSIDGIGVNSRFAAALYLDVGSFLLFFAEPQPDTSYLAKAYDAGANVSVVERSTDYILIAATDDVGAPTDPAEISVEIIRVG